jgi:hypothetical protein
VKVITTTNSQENPSPDHRRLMQFLLHQQRKYSPNRQRGSPSRSISPLALGGAQTSGGDGSHRTGRSGWIAPPPMPAQYQSTKEVSGDIDL